MKHFLTIDEIYRTATRFKLAKGIQELAKELDYEKTHYYRHMLLNFPVYNREELKDIYLRLEGRYWDREGMLPF